MYNGADILNRATYEARSSVTITCNCYPLAVRHNGEVSYRIRLSFERQFLEFFWGIAIENKTRLGGDW